MRTIIDLPEEDLEALKKICRREKISRAEAVRRAVRVYLHARMPSAGEDAFGLWRDRDDVEAREYEDRLRDEWEEGEGGS